MPEPSNHTFGQLTVGMRTAFTVPCTRGTVDAFAELSGDVNPLHTDDVFAATTELRGVVGHGMIAGMLFSRLVGMHLPGRHALYLSQSLRFRRPMRPGMMLRVEGEIVAKTDAVRCVTMKTAVRDDADLTVLVDGEAVVKVLI